MKLVASWVVMIGSIFGVVASCTMILAPLPDKPAIVSHETSRRESKELTEARAKLYEAEMANYVKCIEEDRERLANRPLWERWWPAYLIVSILLLLASSSVVFKA